MRQFIPEIKVIRPEGTYLVWLNCRRLNMDTLELKNFLYNKAKVGLDHGCKFGEEGQGFVRMNIACPRETLKKALFRIASQWGGTIKLRMTGN